MSISDSPRQAHWILRQLTSKSGDAAISGGYRRFDCTLQD